MVTEVSPAYVRRQRLHAQQLIRLSDTVQHPAQVVRDVGGFQAQEWAAARLSVRARNPGMQAQTLEHAREQERSVVRTWAQRNTLHLLSAEDLPWMLKLFGPVFLAQSARRRAELGLDDALCQRATEQLCALLAAQGPLTRAAIFEQLASRDLHFEGQARPHLLGYAALHGRICFGPDVAGEPGYVLLADWLPQTTTDWDTEQALNELTLRYLRAYGPTTPHDYAAWSGLPLTTVRAAWKQQAHQLKELRCGATTLWQLAGSKQASEPLSEPHVRLLPRFDTYLLGYRDRDLLLPAAHSKRVNSGGGMVAATVLVDGEVAGLWRKQRGRTGGITVEWFEQDFQPSNALQEALQAEIAEVLAFEG